MCDTQRYSKYVKKTCLCAVTVYRLPIRLPTESALTVTLHRSDHGKVWRALDLRAELKKEEKDKAEGLPQQTRQGGWWNCLPCVRPSERERERARQRIGEIDMSIDDRACLVSRWASRMSSL